MLFRLSEVHKSYGTQDVLRGVSLQINPGEHVGLVGRNGSGKTTIFRLINNEEPPDRGEVIRARGTRLGLLAQHIHFEPGSTVHESALAAFGHLQQIEHEMHELEHRMGENPDDLEKFSSATAIYNISLSEKADLNTRPKPNQSCRVSALIAPPGPWRRRSCQAVSKIVLASFAFCLLSLTSFCWTSRPTIWM